MGRWLGVVLLSVLGLFLSWVGFVNLFWGNDPFFGLAIFSASTLYYLPAVLAIRSWIGLEYWRWLLGVLAVLIVWAALGVGELGEKAALMRESFPMPNITGI